MRRGFACAIAAAVAVGLTGCGGATVPDPSPTPDPVGVYDGVDLAPLLVERPFVGFADRGFEIGPWRVEEDRRLISELDPAAFAGEPECEAALERVQPVDVEVLVGGYDLQDRFQPRVSVARLASAEDATAYLAALDAATEACVGVQGELSTWDAELILDSPVETPLADAAGFETFTLDYSGEPRGPRMNLVAAVEELVVVLPLGFGSMVRPFEDADLIARMQTQVDAIDAARP
ncbi:hypothetical protein [Agrococcus jejuensis]|uniref:PknH-like extracellular domain-containing protein n=1 Tax=Agrococcus jejuensis TaxID=399736 RepID=A0A1G8E557_9MICO|nr:hypothetical protein [Agrococcus jejuensis]SDH65004.1 hypothetical protein SAMN04489720_1891 [Agrococcus jejuensis]